MNHLTTFDQFQSLLDNQSDRILFKHSGTCSISGGACREVEMAIQELKIDNIYLLDVLNTGDLKYQIADYLRIKHESPQVIIFQGGKVKAHASHGTISKGWFAQKLVGRNDTRKA